MSFDAFSPSHVLTSARKYHTSQGTTFGQVVTTRAAAASAHGPFQLTGAGGLILQEPMSQGFGLASTATTSTSAVNTDTQVMQQSSVNPGLYLAYGGVTVSCTAACRLTAKLVCATGQVASGAATIANAGGLTQLLLTGLVDLQSQTGFTVVSLYLATTAGVATLLNNVPDNHSSSGGDLASRVSGLRVG